jgi:hypothetical protein
MLNRAVPVEHPVGSSWSRQHHAKKWLVLGSSACALVVVAALGVHSRVIICRFGGGKIDTANWYVHEYVAGYERWSRDNSDHRCPNQLSDLNVYTHREPANILDPWNKPMRMTCVGDQIRVTSAGPDLSFDTADDIQDMSAASAATRSTE